MHLSSFRFVWLLLPLLLLTGGGCRPSPSPPRNAPAAAAPPAFVEITESAGIDFRHHHGGSGRRYYPETMGAGCALFDYDGDGWLDLFLVQGAPLPGCKDTVDWRHRLYRGGPQGRFEDVTDRSGVGGTSNGRKQYGMGCATGDIDNDGDPDLLVTGFGACLLYRNNGDGTFADITTAAGLGADGFWSSAVFTDYDRDGRLDLFVCRYVTYRLGDDEACNHTAGIHTYCSPKSFVGSASRLYRNLDGRRFADVTRAAGVYHALGKALGVVAADLDRNGWPDLYVASDTVRNTLFQNRDGKFTERAIEAGVAIGSAGVAYGGMGVASGDIDGDGDADLLVANYTAEPAALYSSEAGGLYLDRSREWGLSPTADPWVKFGCGLPDLDLDGRLDCVIVSGHVFDHPELFSPRETQKQPSLVFMQDATGQFRALPETSCPWLGGRYVARGLARGDLDRDGDEDLVVSQNHGAPLVLRNDLTRGRSWLQVRLRGTRSNRDALGAQVTLTAGGHTQVAEVRSGDSYCSASDPTLTFGLDRATQVDSLQIRWPSGRAEQFSVDAVNQRLTLTEGAGRVLRVGR